MIFHHLLIGIVIPQLKSKTLLIETVNGTKKAANNQRPNLKGNDYMDVVPGGESVAVGNSARLSCTSNDVISKCYFYEPRGLSRYEIRPGEKYHGGRIGCLCDVSLM